MSVCVCVYVCVCVCATCVCATCVREQICWLNSQRSYHNEIDFLLMFSFFFNQFHFLSFSNLGIL